MKTEVAGMPGTLVSGGVPVSPASGNSSRPGIWVISLTLYPFLVLLESSPWVLQRTQIPQHRALVATLRKMGGVDLRGD